MSKKAKWEIGGGVIIAAIAVFVILQFVVPSSGGSTARFGVPSAKAEEPIGHIGTGPAAEALEKAGNSDKYVYALFYNQENDQTAKARNLIESARDKISRKSQEVDINISDPAEQDVVAKFGASRSPMPLLLVLAPNGAIMGGFPVYQLGDDAKLVDAVGSKASEQALKALQQKNMVALCVQNRKTAENAGSMRSVQDFLKDPKYGPMTAVVTADPADPADAKFLSKLGVDLNSPIATTVLLAPPGAVIGTFQGAVQKDKLVAAVQAAAAPKAGGCCPSGSGKSCGPASGAAAPQKSPMTAQPMTLQPQVRVKQVTTNPTTSAAAPTTKSADPATKQGK